MYDKNFFRSVTSHDLDSPSPCYKLSHLLRPLPPPRAILGIRGIVKTWFIDYLKNRIQYVCYKGSASPHKIISCGVPQGSILGPLLFLIYINDLAATSTLLKFIMFADDTNVFLSHKSIDKLFEIMNT